MENIKTNNEFNEQRLLADRLLKSVDIRNSTNTASSTPDSYISLKNEFDNKVADKEGFVKKLREMKDDLTADFIEKLFLI